MPTSYSSHQFAPPLSDVRLSNRAITAPSAWPDNGRRQKPRLGRRLARAAGAFFTIGRRQAVINELSSLSDRELADIGLNRYDIGRVFDPAFAAEHRARG